MNKKSKLSLLLLTMVLTTVGILIVICPHTINTNDYEYMKLVDFQENMDLSWNDVTFEDEDGNHKTIRIHKAYTRLLLVGYPYDIKVNEVVHFIPYVKYNMIGKLALHKE